VAHTADDQAETVLLNLLRGAGLGGVAGMRMDEQVDVRRLGPRLPGEHGALEVVRLARPLLSTPRTLTRAYCDQEGLSVVEDASNFSRAYTRNRVRLDVLPALERFNPAIRTVLSRTAELAADDLAALDAITAALHLSLVRRDSDGELEYELAGWRAQPRPLQRRLLRYALERLLGDLTDVRAQPIEDALDLLRSGHRGQTYHLPYGVELCLSSDRTVLRRHGRAQPRHKLNITLGADPSRV
jgi:tRNA(Ile)-lysidine synthase